MGLCLTMKYGDIVKIGDAEVFIEKYSGNQIRVYIKAPKTTEVLRDKAKKNKKDLKKIF